MKIVSSSEWETDEGNCGLTWVSGESSATIRVHGENGFGKTYARTDLTKEELLELAEACRLAASEIA